jgi:hypothetical protein
MGRPPGSVLRRAGGKARTTSGCASSLGAGGSFRCAQLATGASGVRCSPAAAMATAAGLGCSREERRLGLNKQCALARGSRVAPHGGPRHGQGSGEAHRSITAQGRRGARTVETSLAGGAGRFCTAHERAARGRGGLGANIGAEALGLAVAAVLRRSCPVGGAAGATQCATSCVGANRHGSNFEWPCLTAFYSKIFNRSGPSDQQQSCRSPNPLPLSQRAYGLFLNHLCTNWMPRCRNSRLQ